MFRNLKGLFTIIATLQASSLFAETPNLRWEIVESSNCTTAYEEPAREVTFSNVTPEALNIWASSPGIREISLLQRAEFGEVESHTTRISLYDHMEQCVFQIELSTMGDTEHYNASPRIYAVHGALIGDLHNGYRYLLADTLRNFLCDGGVPPVDRVSILSVERAGFETTPWREPLPGQTQPPDVIASCEDIALFLQSIATTYWFAHGDQGGGETRPLFATVANNIVVDFAAYTTSTDGFFDPQAIGVNSN